MDISGLRRDYMSQGIDLDNLDSNPFTQFEIWFKQALDADLADANAFYLATVGEHGMPTIRTLLIKHFDQKGFVFFTNYESKKGKEIEHNPSVSALFTWLPLNRQIRVEGRCEKVSVSDSEKYFQARPRGSQIAAWCSHQSELVDSRAALEEQFSSVESQYEGRDLPLPPFWGGYRIVPDYLEFWQGRENRLHDRIAYQLDENAWVRARLAP